MKIKYKIISLLFLIFSFFVIVPSMADGSGERIISNITPRFCNSGEVTTKLNLSQVEVDKDINICLAILNSSDIDVNIAMSFVDAGLEKATGNLTCNSDDEKKVGISKYISFPSNELNGVVEDNKKIIFKIKPGETLYKNAILHFSPEFIGMSKGCLITQVSDQEIVKGKINILVRRGNIITASASGVISDTLDINNQNLIVPKGYDLITKNKQIVVLKNNKNGNYYIGTNYVNNGNVKLKVKTSYLLSNDSFLSDIKSQIFGTASTGTVKNIDTENEIEPGDSKLILKELKDFPVIGIGFNGKLSITYSTILDYDSDFAQKNKSNLGNIFESKFSFNILPLFFVISLIGILLFFAIFLVILKIKGKKRY